MNTTSQGQPNPRSVKCGRPAGAFTLPELMVTTAIFSMAVLAIISVNMFGLRQDELVRSKLGASDQSRIVFGKLSSEIRSAKIFRVGNGSQTGFTPVPDGQPQQGTALRIYPTTSTNSYIQYYFDPEHAELRRTLSGGADYDVMADHLTNNMFFRAEDFAGNLLSELEHNYIVAFQLQFYQYQYPITRVGPGYYYDYYKIEFKVTRRAHD